MFLLTYRILSQCFMHVEMYIYVNVADCMGIGEFEIH